MDAIELLTEFLKAKWRGVKYIKGKKLQSITTNDMDSNGRLMPDYLERRKKRKKKKNGAAVGTPDIGIHDIWKT